MKIHELDKLTDIDQYHAAEALIDELLDCNDPESEDRLDKLFKLVSEYETENDMSLDFQDPDDRDYDDLEWY